MPTHLSEVGDYLELAAEHVESIHLQAEQLAGPETCVRLRFGQRISVRVLDPILPAQLSDSSFRALEREMKRMAFGSEMAPVRRYEPEVDGWWDGYRFEIDPDFSEVKALVDAHRSTAEGRLSDTHRSG